MVNEENAKNEPTVPPAETETEEQQPVKKPVKKPIGGIKMPGFCRSKSEEKKEKEEDAKAAEANETGGGGGDTGAKDADTLPADNKAAAAAAAAGGTPAKEAKEKEGGARRGFLGAIRLPLANVFSRKKEADAELGNTGPATGLASAETLDDAAQEKKNAAAAAGDGMEAVCLDAEAADGAPPVKPHTFAQCISAARRNIIVSGVTLLVFVLVLVLVSVALAGPRRNVPQPIKDGKVRTQTSCGPVEGLLEEDAFVFRGIPYAVPPVNDRRWQPSEPLSKIDFCWNGTYLAHNVSKTCWQRNGTTRGGGSISGDEDCLYLDVYTPQVLYEKPLAVVVMIGADTLSGPSPGIMIPSGKLARVRDMVYVRPNFRLDVFGFLSVEPLSRAAHPPSSGNYGLSDIINVLEWVNLNIEHFGGDKSRVTLWGHRAGGTLVTALVGSDKANGLFSRAWISSGSAIFPASELRESEKRNAVFLDNINCEDAQCLKNKKAEDVMRAVPSEWLSVNDGLPLSRETGEKKHEWLVKDDIIIKKHIGEIFSTKELPVKVVMGTTAQSGQLPKQFTYNMTVEPKAIKSVLFENDSLLASLKHQDKVLTQYNATLKGLHTIISDIRVVCPLMAVATMKADIPFYVSTFPRDVVADVDSDAAAILGFFPNQTPEQRRHLQAIQQLFKHFVWHGEVKDFTNGQRILIVDQDVLPRAGYDNCKLWVNETMVPAYGRVD